VINGGAAYTEASARITATEVLTLPFIWTFQSRTAGRIARDQSVRISIALKKNETLLLSCRLHVPFASPQSVSIGVPARGK
jgi:hypothetical protein